VKDLRLSLEIGAIQRLAESLYQRLASRDPLSDAVHHSPAEALAMGVLGVGRTLKERLSSRISRTAAP
jgi:hypothetical protein